MNKEQLQSTRREDMDAYNRLFRRDTFVEELRRICLFAPFAAPGASPELLGTMAAYLVTTD